MAVNTNFNIPFLPQEGITQQVLGAIQLANEHNIARQRLALQQQAQPSEIALRTAQTGQTEAETAAIPQRLALTKEQIEAENALRVAQLNAEQSYRMGILGVRQTDVQRKQLKDATDLELNKFKALWTTKLDQAKIEGISGNLKLRSESLAQQRDLMEQELALRGQANQLREQGLGIQADSVNARADDVVNKIGLLRNITNQLGITEGRTPNAANPPAPTRTPNAAAPAAKAPTRPKNVPTDYIFDNATRTWRPPQ